MKEPTSYFLDITPQLHNPYGDVFTLGTVRYRLTEEMIGRVWEGISHAPTYRVPGPLGSDLSLIFTIRSADAPQPETLTEQPIGGEA